MSRLKTYAVTFTDARYMRVELKARSPDAAIRKAGRLYLDAEPGDGRFYNWNSDAFSDPEAEEIAP